MPTSTLAPRAAAEALAQPSPIRSLPQLAAAARRRRKAMRLTQRELAALAGVSRDTVLAFEHAAPAEGGGEGSLAKDVGFERVLSLLTALGLSLICVGDGKRSEDTRAVKRSAETVPRHKAATPCAAKALPSSVGAFDPAGAMRLRWGRASASGEGAAEEATPIEARDLTAAQVEALRELSAKYVHWIPAQKAACENPGRVLVRAMEVGGDALASTRAVLLELFSIALLRRALRYGRAQGWFSAGSGGDARWETILREAEAAGATETAGRALPH
ncbi:hypothetical protein [Burkholderia pseudomallei]|uniref:hypothetical protein n=1 Tax=Burkholderia pseudomallei TaxID=28450 RepID=UPI000F086D27|nr:hypothetical protein [Burkholderia pseudomallei]CAJ3080398.1 transcriptional regulator, y4mF family [Burkholderia pseudomallei]VCK80321.1 transcriptional regulator, y4mF family [Burkholderia pseudomallei]VCK83529.1 transcriptional regulator, y4mF family [Burkholderia pseudomallei]VCK91510.1 transcriptional regulator, y4mF family [Burkholderia pseudomallei]VCK96812.1 transcriptional regulator, y4mF family [Burkholderia pseudomallei]